MPIVYPYTQYSGVWTLDQANYAVAKGTWPIANPLYLYTWGYNGRGSLGNGNTTNYSSPIQIGTSIWNTTTNNGASNAVLAIRRDGTLWSWGGNGNGVLGLGNTTNYSSPKQVGSLSNWASVSTGVSSFSLSVKTDGTLWSWGSSPNGELGLNNATYYSSPKQVGALTNWKKVSAGWKYSLALKTDGTLWSWGLNNSGQLGLNNTTSYSSPKQIGNLTNWLSVTASTYSSYAIKTDGTLWAWGANSGYGQLGLGNTTSYSSPKQVGILTNWLSVSAGYYHCVALKTDGTIWAWGQGNQGQLGLGNITNYSSPKQVGALTNWSSLGVLSFCKSSSAIKTNGTLWVWGSNSIGQLGLGNTTYYSSPKQVGSATNWVSICIDNSETTALKGS